jgi:hypothetical protein
MKPVERSEILDWVTYEERRAELRPLAIATKSARRIQVGDAFAFLFENRDTVRYQVQEMVRTERMVREADIQHELATYNELLGGPGELGCTLLIGIDDETERNAKLRAWLALPQHIYAKRDDGTLVRATFDPRQVGTDRLSAVQYLKLPVGERAPVTIGIDLPGLVIETALAPEQRAALQSDLDAP